VGDRDEVVPALLLRIIAAAQIEIGSGRAMARAAGAALDEHRLHVGHERPKTFVVRRRCAGIEAVVRSCAAPALAVTLRQRLARRTVARKALRDPVLQLRVAVRPDAQGLAAGVAHVGRDGHEALVGRAGVGRVERLHRHVDGTAALEQQLAHAVRPERRQRIAALEQGIVAGQVQVADRCVLLGGHMTTGGLHRAADLERGRDAIVVVAEVGRFALLARSRQKRERQEREPCS
jgi:hypothetical protein